MCRPSGIGPRIISYIARCTETVLPEILTCPYPPRLVAPYHSQQPVLGSGSKRSSCLAPRRLSVLGISMASILSGCAATGTVAFGEHSVARISCPTGAITQTAPQVIGTKRTETEVRDGKVGPDDVTKTITTEPALAPVPEQAPLHESQGAKVSAEGAGLVSKLFWALKAIGCVATVGTVCGL